ncbi:MAG: hypothetical protein WA700_11580 [Acidobacteriaceae bacterium]
MGLKEVQKRQKKLVDFDRQSGRIPDCIIAFHSIGNLLEAMAHFGFCPPDGLMAFEQGRSKKV